MFTIGRKWLITFSLLFCIMVSINGALATTQNLVYDANGNLVTGDGKYREYDGFNHLVRIRTGNNATGLVLEEYDWHPLEERTLVKHVYENGSWKESIYYPSKDFVRVKNTSGTYDYKYIYQNGQLVAQELVGGQKNFMLNDHKGTVSVVVNESGAKIEETFYSPTGEIISGGAVSRFDYEGKEYDSVVGHTDFNARQKIDNPPIFAQPDTLLPNVYDPQQLNRYAFERNNPLKYMDKMGNNIEGIDTNIEAASYNLANGLLLAKEYFGLSKEAFSNKEYSLSINYGGQGASEIFDATWKSFAIAGFSATAVYNPQSDAASLLKEVTPKFSSEMDEEQKRIIESYYENKNKELIEARKKLSEEIGGPTNPNIQSTNPITAYAVLGSKGSGKESKSSGSSSAGFKIVTLKSGATLSASPKMQSKLKQSGLVKSK